MIATPQQEGKSHSRVQAVRLKKGTTLCKTTRSYYAEVSDPTCNFSHALFSGVLHKARNVGSSYRPLQAIQKGTEVLNVDLNASMGILHVTTAFLLLHVHASVRVIASQQYIGFVFSADQAPFCNLSDAIPAVSNQRSRCFVHSTICCTFNTSRS